MGNYIIQKIGLVTVGDKKGLYKLSLDGNRYAYITEEELNTNKYEVGNEYLGSIDLTPEEELTALKKEIKEIIRFSEKATQNNAYVMLTSATNQLSKLINYKE